VNRRLTKGFQRTSATAAFPAGTILASSIGAWCEFGGVSAAAEARALAGGRMVSAINWMQLAESIGCATSAHSGEQRESSGSGAAREAIVLIAGEQVWIDAVDVYVEDQPGAELARSVLWLIHPWPAMRRCFEIFDSSGDIAKRRSAVELLRVVADRRVVPWLDRLIRDPDSEIQLWAAGIVDQLAWSSLIENTEARSIVDSLQEHPNPGVRERASFIREFLQERESAG